MKKKFAIVCSLCLAGVIATDITFGGPFSQVVASRTLVIYHSTSGYFATEGLVDVPTMKWMQWGDLPVRVTVSRNAAEFLPTDGSDVIGLDADAFNDEHNVHPLNPHELGVDVNSSYLSVTAEGSTRTFYFEQVGASEWVLHGTIPFRAPSISFELRVFGRDGTPIDTLSMSDFSVLNRN